MAKIKLLLLALLFTAMPTGLYAYTNGQIIKINDMNYKVTSVDNHWLAFLNADNVVGELVIPETVSDGKGTTFTVTGVTFVGGYLCEKITSVKLPESITYLDAGVFSGAKLESINIPKKVNRIEETANNQLKKVPKYTVSGDNPHFSSDSQGALYSKDGKTLRFVPSDIPLADGVYTVNRDVENIKNSCFSLIEGLKKIILPPNLKEISVGYPSIAPINSLEEFEIASGGTTPFRTEDGVLCKGEELMFYPRAKNTENYVVPNSITTLVGFAIAYPEKMKTIDLNKVTNLAKSSLFSAYKLTTITLPEDLKKYDSTTKKGMEPGCFGACTGVDKYIVPSKNTDFEAVDGVIYSKPKRDILYFYPAGKPGEVYDILSTTKVIEALAFWSVQKIKAMTFPKGLEAINDEAFRQLPNLESVIFVKPSDVKHLGTAVFRACPKLKVVTLPSKVTSLDKPFDGCSNLETINIPDGSQLKKLLSNSFSTNKKLKHFNFEGSCQLEEIESDAFAYLPELESFTFPKTVKTIKINAFRGCKGMTKAEFPNDAEIEVIGQGAFADCGLKTFTVPNNVRKIEREAFNKCEALDVVNISAATTEINPEAFKSCFKLTDINVSKDNTVYSSIDGYLLSKDKKTLKIFPAGKANDRFTLLPPSITTIGEYAFYDCTVLKNIVIPNKVERIGKRAFGLCKNLSLITFLCDKVIDPANINQAKNEMSFDDGTQAANMFEHITIHVRKELYDEYNSKNFYNKFKGVIEKSFIVGTEEYIPVSETVVDMLKTESTNHTFVLPANVKHPNKDKTYSVNLIGDYAFQKTTDKVKEVVVKKNIEYIGAQAFVTDLTNKTSTVKNVFFIESAPTKKMLSTTRFELDETKTDYSEFAKTTHIYVKKSALPTYKTAWAKTTYNTTTQVEEKSPFDFTSQLKYQIPGVTITDKYGTFAREFDVDFSIYNKEKNKGNVAAFVGKISEVLPGDGDYGHSTYHIRMSSVDMNGVGNGNFGYVPAETGVLLKVLDQEKTPDDFYYAIGEDDDKNYTITNNIMHGVTVNPRNAGASTVDEVIYVMQKGIFKKAMASTVSIPVHKAYAKIEGMPAGSKVEFSFSDDNTTNAIVTVDAEEKNADNAYYNLNGQRVNKPQQGIYIHKGKKIVIR